MAIQPTCQPDGLLCVLVFAPEAGIGTKIKNHHCEGCVLNRRYRNRFLLGLSGSMDFEGFSGWCHSSHSMGRVHQILGSKKWAFPALGYMGLLNLSNPLPHHITSSQCGTTCRSAPSPPWHPGRMKLKYTKLEASVCYGQVPEGIFKRPRLQCSLQSPPCPHPDLPLKPMAVIPALPSPQIASPQADSLLREADGCHTISKFIIKVIHQTLRVSYEKDSTLGIQS